MYEGFRRGQCPCFGAQVIIAMIAEWIPFPTGLMVHMYFVIILADNFVLLNKHYYLHLYWRAKDCRPRFSRQTNWLQLFVFVFVFVFVFAFVFVFVFVLYLHLYCRAEDCRPRFPAK